MTTQTNKRPGAQREAKTTTQPIQPPAVQAAPAKAPPVQPPRHRPRLGRQLAKPPTIRAGSATADGTELHAVASIMLAAGAATEGGGVRFKGSALSGGPMKPRGFSTPVVIDVAGLEIAPNVALLADHDDRAIDSVLGSVTVQPGRGGALEISGEVVPGSRQADRTIGLLKSGATVAASVGVRPDRTETLRAGQSATVNGSTVTAGPAGLTIVRAGHLYEVSLVAIGADRRAGVRIAATGAGEDDDAGDQGQDDNDQGDRGTLSAGAERRRIKAIKLRTRGHPDIEAQAIDHGWTPERAELETFRRGGSPTILAPRRGIGSATPADVLCGALLRLTGQAAAGERMLGAATMNAADSIRAHTALDLFESALRLEGRDIPTSRDGMIRAALSTASLPVALGGGIDKLMQDQLRQSPSTWMKIARKVPLSNFRETSLVRLTLAGGLEEVAEGGELKHATLGEVVNKVRLDTFGKIVTLGRKAIINDDLSLFSDLPVIMAGEWSRKLQDLVWGTLVDGADTFFTTERGNLIEGADSVLSVPGLSLAVQALREVRDEDGRILDMSPSVLAVPPALEAVGRALIKSSEVGIADVDGVPTPTANPHRDIAELVVEPRLGASNGASDDQWYLFAAVGLGAVNLGLLNGRESPIVEMRETDINTLGTSWRIYGDCGCALGEHRAGVASLGGESGGE
ncbi:MAG: Mu-like prophage major head subunit gpT family protein [Phycisphaeraceae bacterium]|nr:Mu-like prophage major head subunit gpT family protein [Phycisphaeraceae bacterium]